MCVLHGRIACLLILTITACGESIIAPAEAKAPTETQAPAATAEPMPDQEINLPEPPNGKDYLPSNIKEGLKAYDEMISLKGFEAHYTIFTIFSSPKMISTSPPNDSCVWQTTPQ